MSAQPDLLLPCPFCGSIPHLSFDRLHVRCRGECIAYEMGVLPIDLWNTRAAPSAAESALSGPWRLKPTDHPALFHVVDDHGYVALSVDAKDAHLIAQAPAMRAALERLLSRSPIDFDGECVFCSELESNHKSDCPWITARRALTAHPSQPKES